MPTLYSSKLKSGTWDFIYHGSLSYNRDIGSWKSNQDGAVKGFWTYNGNNTASVYYDNNNNNNLDYGTDEYLGNAYVNHYNGSDRGGTWDRFYGYAQGAFQGDAWGQWELTVPLIFDTSESNDIILGTTLNDTIDGKGGDDYIVSGAGDDTVIGGSGSDRLLGGAGNDFINGGAEPIADFLYGEEDNDYLAGGGGPDQLYGGTGNDEIRAGHGKDTISGGDGADILYGGGGTNSFLSEADGSIDQLYVMSDLRGHAFDWGRNHGGINADIITELDTNDRITILGTSDSALTFRAVAAGTYNQTRSGIGIFDGDSLETLYIGSNLNASQLDSMTTGDPTRFS